MNVNTEQYPDILVTAAALISAAREDDGATLDRYGRLPVVTGWAVGGACTGFNVPSIETYPSKAAAPGGLATRVARWIQAQPSNVEYFGSWQEMGCVYFDGVDIIPAYLDAIMLAFERGEKAIYNLATGQTEYVTAASHYTASTGVTTCEATSTAQTQT